MIVLGRSGLLDPYFGGTEWASWPHTVLGQSWRSGPISSAGLVLNSWTNVVLLGRWWIPRHKWCCSGAHLVLGQGLIPGPVVLGHGWMPGVTVMSGSMFSLGNGVWTLEPIYCWGRGAHLVLGVILESWTHISVLGKSDGISGPIGLDRDGLLAS